MSHIHNKILSRLSTLDGAYSPETLRSYYSDARQFVDWCSAAGRAPFPLAEDTLVAYVTQAGDAQAYATLRRRLSALRRVNALLGHGAPQLGEAYRVAIRRHRRSRPAASRQARGVNRALLLRAIAAQPDTLTGTRNRALLSLGYDFLARRSELTALRISDVTFEGAGLRGVIRRGKADPYGRGRLVYGSKRSAALWKRWLRAKPPEIPWAFCALGHGRCIDRPICGRTVGDIIKRAIVKTRGARPRDWEISGHSLRVGAAQDLLLDGHDLAAIMRAGGWSSVGVAMNYLRLAEHNIWERCADDTLRPPN